MAVAIVTIKVICNILCYNLISRIVSSKAKTRVSIRILVHSRETITKKVDQNLEKSNIYYKIFLVISSFIFTFSYFSRVLDPSMRIFFNSWASKLQILAVPSLLPLKNLADVLANWMLSTQLVSEFQFQKHITPSLPDEASQRVDPQQ
ncbi:hypothetical protein BpHYR1_024604 [Brachionus plicatilis]|uniref:Uncharacterized protein n=1 Tax=Brachionus plicatilis TaxID=10195 RepID=A0A3M7SR61_BRAPC|nr:hypothetical protein BpHYR1_024604 [Brachionus plicatilis]